MLHEFENLPPLTTAQANAISALSACGSLFEASSQSGMSYAEFIDCLSSDAVRAHLAAIRRITRHRTQTRIADAAHTAAEALDRIAEDPASPIAAGSSPTNQDPAFLLTERRRAATTLIRAFTHQFTRPRMHHTSPERSDTSPERKLGGPSPAHTKNTQQSYKSPERKVMDPTAPIPQSQTPIPTVRETTHPRPTTDSGNPIAPSRPCLGAPATHATPRPKPPLTQMVRDTDHQSRAIAPDHPTDPAADPQPPLRRPKPEPDLNGPNQRPP